MCLAALAESRGQRAGKGEWRVLCPEMAAAVEEIMLILERTEDQSSIERAVLAAMGPDPATASPSWAEPLWRDPDALERLGAALDASALSCAVGHGRKLASDRDKGVAAAAIALCRSLDSLKALSLKLPEQDQDKIMRMGHLAQVASKPGEPSRVRAEVRRILGQGESDG